MTKGSDSDKVLKLRLTEALNRQPGAFERMESKAQMEKAHFKTMKCALVLLCQQKADLIVGNMAWPPIPVLLALP
jgi:hypothetical protein